MKSLANNFLIAMPGLQDDRFSQSVTLICHHDDDGAMGVIINQPLQLNAMELFSDAGLPTDKLVHPDKPVWYGGPVKPDHVFALHDSSHEWQHTLAISSSLRLTSSTDFIDALADGENLDNYLLILGFAGWEPAQLEFEMAENSWIYATADNQLVFEMAFEKRWQSAAKLAGIDLDKMSYYSGKA